MENVSLLDLISIALILFLGIKGLFRGFMKETFGLIGIIGGIYVASRYAQPLGSYLDTTFLHLQNKGSLYLIGFLAALFGFWIVASLLGGALGKLVNASGLGLVDKILGFAVGGAKVFLIFSVIIYVLTSIPVFKSTIENVFEGSMMYPYFTKVGAQIVKLDPTQLAQSQSSKSPILDDEAIQIAE